jgi:prophage antirepressor-like protein
MTELINQIDMSLSFNDNSVRILGTTDKPLFVVKDICKILGIGNTTEILRNIPDKWKGSLKLNTSQGMQIAGIINESGLYKIIMNSRKPIAQPFQEFVCEEILPSIRKTGEYKLQAIIDEKNKLQEEKLKIEEEKQKVEEKNQKLEEDKKTLETNLSDEQKELISTKKSLLRVQGKFSKRYKFPNNGMGCVYILEDPDCKYGKFKIGMTHDINERLEQDRTMVPKVKVHYIMYTEQYILFEKNIKIRHGESLELPSHEWIFEDLDAIIQSYEEINKACGFNSIIEKNLWRYNLEEPPEDYKEEEEKLEEKKEKKIKKKEPKNIPYYGSEWLSDNTKFLPSRLVRCDYINKNKKAVTGHRYCNGFCQTYHKISAFNKQSTYYMCVCENCQSMFEKAKLKLESGVLTIEQIRDNPSLVKIGGNEMMCRKCKQVKDKNDFPEKRRQCKQCKWKKRTDLVEDFSENIDDIIVKLKSLEEKDLILKLNRYAKLELYKLLSHLCLGRKSTDRKSDAVDKLIKYFS